MVVKGNHPTLQTKLQSLFACPALYEAEFDEAVTLNRGHGRVERRRLRLTYDLPRFFTGFAGVRQAFCLERERLDRRSGKVSREVVVGITSLPRLLANASRLLEIVRGHWTIENRVHYVRDVTMGEDRSHVHAGHVPEVMAAFRNAAIAILRRAGYENVASARRYLAANPRKALKLLGETITE